MARPIKDSDDKRAVTIRARVTVAERQRLEQKAMEAGMTLSDWVRSQAIDKDALLRKLNPEKEILLRLLAELGKQGSNCNQIARQLNRKQENIEFEVPIAFITQTMESIRILSEQIREALNNGNQRQDQGSWRTVSELFADNRPE